MRERERSAAIHIPEFAHRAFGKHRQFRPERREIADEFLVYPVGIVILLLEDARKIALDHRHADGLDAHGFRLRHTGVRRRKNPPDERKREHSLQRLRPARPRKFTPPHPLGDSRDRTVDEKDHCRKEINPSQRGGRAEAAVDRDNSELIPGETAAEPAAQKFKAAPQNRFDEENREKSAPVAPLFNPAPGLGGKITVGGEIRRAVRGENRPAEHHQRPRPAVLDDGRHPGQGCHPEKQSCGKPAFRARFRIGAARKPDKRRQREENVHLFAHRRKRRPQQKARQQPEHFHRFFEKPGNHMRYFSAFSHHDGRMETATACPRISTLSTIIVLPSSCLT